MKSPRPWLSRRLPRAARKRTFRESHPLLLEELEGRLVPSANVLTYHNDNSSTGQILGETALTPAKVNSTNFGKLFTTYVDGQVYAQPLYMANVNITTGPGPGTHNVAFVTTEHDDVYAIDADNGQILWHDSFVNPNAGVTPVPSPDTNTSDLSPEVGITSTPVIDPSTGTLYLTAKTKEIVGSDSHYIYRLHALSVADGTEKLGGPVVIVDTISNDLSTYTYVSGPSVNGTGDGSINGVVAFNALRQLQRPALTLANGAVYLGFGSHGDNGPYHGWILGYSASTLQLTAVFNTTPNGSNGAIWQGGGKIAVDAQGNLYFGTGNGTFDTTLNADGFPSQGDYSDSFVKLAVDPTTTATHENVNGWGLKVVDYFTPSNQQNLSDNDLDLGSGGPLLLPDAVGNTAHQQLMIGAGKQGSIYLLDRNNMGKFDPHTDHVVQELPSVIHGSFDTPAYFNGAIYYVSGFSGPADAFSIANATLSAAPTSQSSDSYSFPGPSSSISANGNTNGIVWELDHGSNELRAYDATNYTTELYTSSQAANNRDLLGSVVKFTVPTVANGKVYVGTSNSLKAYGLFPTPVSPPVSPSNLTATASTSSEVALAWTDDANDESGYLIEQSTDGSHFTQVGSVPANSTVFSVTGLQPKTTYTFRVRAFNAVGNSAYSNTATATTPATPGAGGLDFSRGFGGSTGLLTFNGLPPTIKGTALQLTDGGASEASSAFSTSPLAVTRFASEFRFQILNTTDPSADGFTFCIQRAGATALGLSGGGLGYGASGVGGTGGIPNSVAVKFDLYSNEGEGFNSTGLYVNGAAPTLPGAIDLGGTGIDLHSQDVFNVAMSYNGATLAVTITDTTTGATATQSYAVNIPSIVGGSTAYVGFTAGTGGLASKQSILAWTYTPILVTPPAAPSNLTATATSATQVALSWTANSANQTAFLIERKTGAGGTYGLVGQTTASATNFSDSGLSANTQYFYHVRATNAAGFSAYSKEAIAGLNFSSGFAAAGSLVTLNGPAKLNGAAMQLTDGGAGEAASAFSDNPLGVIRFSTQFTFQILNTTNPSADGFTFCIQGAGATALGQMGGGLGYGPESTGGPGGIPNSVAVKFDLFDNQGEGNDSTGLYTDGAAPTNVGSIDLTSTGIDLHSQHVFNVTMTYDGATLKVTITDTTTNASASQSYAVNIPATVGGDTAYVGFTAGTGGLTATQSILTWTYSPIATLAAPTNVVVAGGSGQAALSWNAVPGAASYDLYRSPVSGGQASTPSRTGIMTTTFTDTGLAAGGTYYYKVSAVNASGEGVKSAEASAITVASAPGHVTATASPAQVMLSWHAPTGAASYNIYRGATRGGEGGTPVMMGVTSTSFTDTGLVGGKIYYYQVTAVDAAGESARSTEVAVGVPKVGTTTVLVSSANPAVFGQVVTLTATVTANVATATIPAGIVFFEKGTMVMAAVPLNGAGQATFGTTALTLGTSSLTAVYNGNPNFLASSSAPISQTVNVDGTTTAVKASANPAVVGQTVTLTAVVRAASPGSGTPTGTATFKDFGTTLGTATLVSGQASFTTASLAVGNHAITASYGGDVHFTASTSRPYGEKVTAAGKLEGSALTGFIAPSKLPTTPAGKASPAAIGPSRALSVSQVDAFFDLSASTVTIARSLPARPRRSAAPTEDWL
jgi:fibronectin type 3 domain-containing protein